jgi:hypothetical protein
MVMDTATTQETDTEVRWVTKFPRGSRTSTEAIKAILSESKDHGFLEGDIFVTEDSPQWQKDEVFLRAEALMISSHHDDPPWNNDYNESVGVLLVEKGGIVGAVGFDNRTFIDSDEEFVEFSEYHQNWRWTFAFIDAQHQRKGYISKRIPKWLTENFGEFSSSRPWSEGMRALFEKIGWYPRVKKVWKETRQNCLNLNSRSCKEMVCFPVVGLRKTESGFN